MTRMETSFRGAAEPAAMDDATAVVTGAATGLGAAVTRAFGDAGATVVAGARTDDREALASVAAAVRDDGGTATTQVADVRDEYDVERLLEAAARESDAGVDVVVAAADARHGTAGETPVAEEGYPAFDDHLRTNARGTFATFREAVPHLADGARLLAPTLQASGDAVPGQGSYGVSRAAAAAVARQFAADLDEAAVGLVAVEGPLGEDQDDTTADHRAAADLLRWVATTAPREALDGGVLTAADRETS